MPGVRHVTVNSTHLRGRGDVTLFVPAGVHTHSPVGLLLHGIYGSHWNWTLLGDAHLTAARLIQAGDIPPMVLAMPSDGLWGSGSGYVERDGRDHGRWVVEEVPRAVHALTPARGPLCIAGLSMGGLGSLSLAARHPGVFSAAVGHSSVPSLEGLMGGVQEQWEGGFLLDDILAATEMPPFRFDCGTEDGLIAANRHMHAALADVPHGWAEYPGGHDWNYWRARLPDTLRFFAAVLRA